MKLTPLVCTTVDVLQGFNRIYTIADQVVDITAFEWTYIVWIGQWLFVFTGMVVLAA